MRISAISLVLSAFFFLPAISAHAAEISCVENWTKESISKTFTLKGAPPENSCAKMFLSGEIVAGDEARLGEALETRFPFAAEILLSSPGGEVRESILMGKRIRERNLRVSAPTSDSCGEGTLKTGGDTGNTLCTGANCVCASACFLLWTGSGTVRQGNVVGIHRPSYYFPTSVFNQALAMYRKQSTMPDLLQIMSEVRDYLLVMGVPENFRDIMTRTASDRVYWLNPQEAASLEFPASGIPAFKNACGMPGAGAGAANAGYISCIDRVAMEDRSQHKNAALPTHPKCFGDCRMSVPAAIPVKALSLP